MYVIDLIKYYMLLAVDKASNGLDCALEKSFFMSGELKGGGGKNAPPASFLHFG